MRVTIKYGLIFIGFAAVLAGTSICLALVYRNEILKSILSSVAQNNHIHFEAEEVKFILSSNLKNTKFLFKNVAIKSKNTTVSTGIFSIQTESVGVEVNLPAFLLHKKVEIEKISVSNGNLQLLSSSEAAQDNVGDIENLLRGIKHLSVDKFTIYAQNKGKSSKVFLNKTALQLSHESSGTNAKIKGNLLFTTINTKFPQPTTNANFDINGALAKGVFSFNKSKITVDGIHLTASGEIGLQPNGKCNLNLTAKNINIEKTLPAIRQYATLDGLESASGRLDASVNIDGNLSNIGRLKLSIQGDFLHGKIKVKGLNTTNIRHLNYSLQGTTISNLKSYGISLTGISASSQDFELNGNLSIDNFSAPIYNASIAFSGDVKTLNMEAIPEGKIVGSINVKMREWSLQGIEKIDALVDIVQLNVMLQKEKHVVNGELLIGKENIASKIDIQSNIVNGSFEGKIHNYLPYLLDGKKPCKISIVGNLLANSLDLDKLFSMKTHNSTLTILANINAQAKEMLLFDEKYKNSSAKVYYEKSSIMVSKLTTNAYGGLLKGDLKIYTPDLGDKKLNIDLYFNDIKIDKLSFLNKNFNIKNGSIQGICSGAISLNSPFDKKGVNFQRAFGSVNITIQNGRLYEFEPIQALSGHVKKRLLQDMRFAALRNTITIENGTLIIPRMEIRSSALSTYISGKQWFNGDFDYHLTLFANELLLQKNRNIENPINDNKTKLFLHFTSKNGKREVSIDSQEWGNNINKKIRREAAEIQANSKGTSVQKNSRVNLEWEEQPVEEDKQNFKNEEEKKKPEDKQKSDVSIEWEP